MGIEGEELFGSFLRDACTPESVEIAAAREDGKVGAEEDFVFKACGFYGSKDRWFIEPGPGSGIVPSVGEGKFHLRHEFIEPQPSSEVGEYHPDFRVVDAEFGGFCGADVSLSGIVVPYWLGGVDEEKHPKFVSSACELPGLADVGEIKILPLRKELPDSYKPFFTASDHFFFKSSGEGRNDRKTLESVGKPLHRVDNVIIAEAAEPKVIEGEAENPGDVHSFFVHFFYDVLGTRPAVDSAARKLGKMGFSASDFFNIPYYFGRVNMHVAVYDH